MYYLQCWRDSKRLVTFHEFDECIADGLMGRRIDKWTDGRTEGQFIGQMNGPMDRRSDELLDEQTL